jgi:deoxycytidylate deaminase
MTVPVELRYSYEEEDVRRPRAVKADQHKYIDLARKMANYSNMRQKHGCVIVHQGVVISYGWNHFNHNMHMREVDSFHAEVDALCRIKKNKSILPHCQLYIVRIGREEPLKNSKPCVACRRAIKEAGIGKVFYST